ESLKRGDVTGLEMIEALQFANFYRVSRFQKQIRVLRRVSQGGHQNRRQADIRSEGTVWTIRTFIFFGVISCATAAPVDVCLVNESSLSRVTLQYVEAGLKAHEKELTAVFRFTCESDARDTVIIRLRNVPAPHQERDALGAVLVENGKVLGHVEVFCDP